MSKIVAMSALMITALIAGCTTQAQAPSPIDEPLSDQGLLGDEMTSTPEVDMRPYQPQADMGTPPKPEDMPPACTPADCVPETTTCAAINTVRHCLRINGCVKERLVPCEPYALCDQAEGQKAKCEWNLCRRAQQRMCAEDQRSSIVCQPTEVPNLFRPEVTPCAEDELCTVDVCKPHECEESALGIPYTCMADNTYTRCQLEQGRRTLIGPVACPRQTRCVPGKFVSALACECEHQCERYNQVRCDPAQSGAYQLCDSDPDTGCRFWRQLTCPEPRPNASFDWHDMGCHQSAQGPAHLKCWTDDGRCTLDSDPTRCL